MVIKRDGLICRIAYLDAKKAPEKVSVCKLFWRFILFALVVWPVILLMQFMVIVIGIIFAGRLVVFKNDIQGVIEKIPYLYRFPPVLIACAVWISYSIYNVITTGFRDDMGVTGFSGATVLFLLCVLLFEICCLSC